jgi:hypothetical protein
VTGTGILFWDNILLFAGFIVNPLLVFVIFFFIGRRIDIANNSIAVWLSLFVGLLIGFWIGFIPEIYFMTRYYGGLEQTAVLVQLTRYDITGSFPMFFFASFSAICTASMVNKTWNKKKTNSQCSLMNGRMNTQDANTISDPPAHVNNVCQPVSVTLSVKLLRFLI